MPLVHQISGKLRESNKRVHNLKAENFRLSFDEAERESE